MCLKNIGLVSVKHWLIFGEFIGSCFTPIFKNYLLFFPYTDNLAKTDPNLCTEERVANAMKHAGISISVTSISGIAAFLIGSTTVII